MEGKKVKIFDRNGIFFSKGIIVKENDNRIYIKYIDDFERSDYGYFDFDIVFDYNDAVDNNRIELFDE